MSRPSRTTYETAQPWCVFRYGLTHDRWWPFWTSTRVLGRARVECVCAVCAVRQVVMFRIPRLGEVPRPPVQADGKRRHPTRQRFLDEHTHPDRGAPMSWALPLLNPEAHPGGLSLDALSMRLEADINEQSP